LEKLLEIKIFGRRTKLFNRMEELKKKHSDEMIELEKMTEEMDKVGLA
jgi:hypothetical protein